MKKLLIVDDEENIREGMNYIIPWSEYGYNQVETAKNGKEGLEKIRTYRPDLIITDIQMPLLNGLDMIDIALAEGFQFYSIVLTGYSEFEYAKKAIELGFVSYLLKPVEEDELITIIGKIKSNQEYEEDAKLTEILYKKFLGEDNTCIENYSYMSVLSINKADSVLFLKELKNIPINFSLLRDNETLHIVLLAHDLIYKIDLDILLKKQNIELLDSGWHPTSLKLHFLYKQIQHLQRYRFLFPNQYLSQIFLNKIQKQTSYCKDITERLVTEILRGGELCALLLQYKNNFLHELLWEYDIKWKINDDYSLIKERIQKQVSDKVVLPKIDFSIYSNFDSIFETFSNILEQAKKQFLEQNHKRDIILEIEQFVKIHYMENLSLKQVALHFGYDSAYLGKKFRKRTNMSFSHFVENIRLKRATELLLYSDDMIYEIAEKVGYSNTDYFYKKFKSQYKLSPNDYRQKALSI